MENLLYLDNSATTPVRPEVVEEMLPYFAESYGNASSIHKQGQKSHQAIDRARKQLASLLHCQPEEIFFTPCGTYSNNTAIIGRARFAEANGQGKHLITSVIEHPSVIGPAKYLEACGWKVTYLPVDREGFVDCNLLKDAISKETSIISIMWANNEIGTIEPIEDIAQIANERGIYFHTDAVQIPGKIEIDLSRLPVSTLALSAHKFYGPKGIGALYVKKGVNLMPVVFGGGQEQGLFPGTENVAAIAGLGKAAELASKELPETIKHLQEASTVLASELLTVEGIKITGPKNLEKRLPGHISIVAPGAKGDAIILRSDLKGICISSGSACHSGVIEPSSVLKAIALPRHEALGSARISCGRFNTKEEVVKAASTLASVFSALMKEPAPIA